MARRVMFLLTVLVTVLLAGCGGQDTPVEQAEEEAGLEEVVEETTEQASVEETTVYQAPPRDAEEAAADEAKKKAADERKEPASNEQNHPAPPNEEADRKESERIVKAYESGMSNVEPVECQLAKAQLDLGSQEAQRLLDEWMAPVTEGPSVRELQEQGVEPKEAMQQVSERMKSKGTLPEYLAEKGYTC